MTGGQRAWGRSLPAAERERAREGAREKGYQMLDDAITMACLTAGVGAALLLMRAALWAVCKVGGWM